MPTVLRLLGFKCQNKDIKSAHAVVYSRGITLPIIYVSRIIEPWWKYRIGIVSYIDDILTNKNGAQ